VPALKDLGERAVVERLKKVFDRGHPVGLGHDVGVVDWGPDYLVITTDAVNAATHIPGGATPGQVGWYLVAVNLSDIAASGAEPLGFVAALALPRETDLEYVEGLAEGMEACAREFGIAVVGGDTKESDVMTLAGTAVGRVPKDRILLRSGARPGDAVVVTGELGRAGWASRHLPDPRRREEALEAFLRVRPRTQEGMCFSRSGAVTSCEDVSDGLGATLHQIAEMSKVSFVIDYDAVPLCGGLRGADRKTVEDLAFYYGGDFELVATVRPDRLADLQQRFGALGGGPAAGKLTVIGRTEPRGGNRLSSQAGGTVPLENRGWEHFRSSHP
jgi:thiamine-monophosphate kinase